MKLVIVWTENYEEFENDGKWAKMAVKSMGELYEKGKVKSEYYIVTEHWFWGLKEVLQTN